MKKYLGYIVFCILSFSSVGQKEFRFRNFSINDGLSQSSVTSLVQDKNDALWVGTQDGLNCFNGKEFEVFTADKTEGLESSYIKCSLIDDEGNLLDSADLDQDREAWKDLWSAGHGVGSIDSVLSTEELVAQLKQEYLAAIEAFEVNSSKFK